VPHGPAVITQSASLWQVLISVEIEEAKDDGLIKNKLTIKTTAKNKFLGNIIFSSIIIFWG